MRTKLTEYLNDLFNGAPDTPKNRELREELLQNSLDKYDDLVKNGTPEATAFNLVVGGLGDVTVLLREIHGNFTAPSSTSTPGTSDTSASGAQRTPDSPETPAAAANESDDRKREQKWAACLAASVMLYIASIIPPIILSNTHLVDTLAPALMFAIIAIATFILLYGKFMFKKGGKGDTEASASSAGTSTGKNSLFASLNGLLWALILVAYFVISFATMSWHVTWLIFPIGGALSGVLKAIFDIIGGTRK